MKIAIFIDPKNNRVVRAYSEEQRGYSTFGDKAKNLAKHEIELTNETLINIPASEHTAKEILQTLKDQQLITNISDEVHDIVSNIINDNLVKFKSPSKSPHK